MRKTNFLFALLLSLTFYVGFAQEPSKDFDAYASQIIELKNADQQARKAFGRALRSGLPVDSLKAAMAQTDKQHSAKLKDLVASYGFPDAGKVGMEATHAFWVLAMHQDDDTDFQNEVLNWMRDAVKRKDVLTRDLAYFEDRMAVNSGRCQVYGTQVDYDEKRRKYVSFPICDMKKVNRLRKKMKLMPLAEQLRRENEGIRK
jgi:hypothetical protein